MEADRTLPADGCPGRRADGRSPGHQRHRACTEERLSLVRLPPEYGPPTTIYNRFVRWARRGIWESLFRELARNGRSTDTQMIDSGAGDLCRSFLEIEGRKEAHFGAGRCDFSVLRAAVALSNSLRRHKRRSRFRSRAVKTGWPRRGRHRGHSAPLGSQGGWEAFRERHKVMWRGRQFRSMRRVASTWPRKRDMPPTSREKACTGRWARTPTPEFNTIVKVVSALSVQFGSKAESAL
jgi:hypothetical protein